LYRYAHCIFDENTFPSISDENPGEFFISPEWPQDIPVPKEKHTNVDARLAALFKANIGIVNGRAQLKTMELPFTNERIPLTGMPNPSDPTRALSSSLGRTEESLAPKVEDIITNAGGADSSRDVQTTRDRILDERTTIHQGAPSQVHMGMDVQTTAHQGHSPLGIGR
jgi:hypothetical protein